MMSSAEMFSFPEIAIFCIVLSVVLGAVFGSFINCVAWRIVAGESPWKGRSHCATCNHPLGALDLVPVLSWLFLRGKCRYCGERISVRYTIVELVMAAYFVSILVVYGLSVQTLMLWVLGVCLLGLSLVDLDSFTIPNGFIIAGIVAWVVYVVSLFAMGDANALGTVTDGLLGGFVIAAAVLVLSLVFDKVLGKQSMGGGDIKLLLVVGLYLGLACSLLNLIVACVVGIVFAFVRRPGAGAAEPASDDEGKAGADSGATPEREGEVERDAEADSDVTPGAGATDDAGITSKGDVDDEEPIDPKAFPFGPAIAVATWFSLLFGQTLVNAYLGLLF